LRLQDQGTQFHPNAATKVVEGKKENPICRMYIDLVALYGLYAGFHLVVPTNEVLAARHFKVVIR
jgi:hypothetical protein